MAFYSPPLSSHPGKEVNGIVHDKSEGKKKVEEPKNVALVPKTSGSRRGVLAGSLYLNIGLALAVLADDAQACQFKAPV